MSPDTLGWDIGGVNTKGVLLGPVLDALESVFPADCLHVYTVTGRFVSPHDARAQPLEVAASNWAATARWAARMVSTCILIDIGTTTTDLIPIIRGKIAGQGRTDPGRLVAGELLYTGALRTPVEAVERRVPLWGKAATLSAEGFATMGDVHLWLGPLKEDGYTCRTPDGRPATPEFAGERLARVVCADREILDESEIDGIAVRISAAQLETISAALTVLRLGRAAVTAPAAAGACLLRDSLAGG